MNADKVIARQSGNAMDDAASASGERRPLVLLSANSSWNIWNFRMDLVRALQAAGFAVAVAAPLDDHSADLENAGITFYPLTLATDGTSPAQDSALFLRYVRILGLARPTAFLGFTAKPNIYGSLAARLRGIPAINNVTGLGRAFIHGSFLERLVASLYRLAFRKSEAVFFHNPEDRDLFVARGLVREEQAQVIPGSGVDLSHFAPSAAPQTAEEPTFLFVGRLLWEKGVGEFVEAARMVKRSRPHARFQVLGGLASGNRAVPKQMLDDWQADGLIDYLGTCGDIRPHLQQADCVVLPSYREGLPRVLLEAAAMSRPAIAADVPGCRQVVENGKTGFLCEPRSASALAEAVQRMSALSPAERERMGRCARARAEERFGVERVWSAYLAAMARISARS